MHLWIEHECAATVGVCWHVSCRREFQRFNDRLRGHHSRNIVATSDYYKTYRLASAIIAHNDREGLVKLDRLQIARAVQCLRTKPT